MSGSSAAPSTAQRSSAHLTRGRQAENRAFDYLLARGLKLVERNFRCRAGEIDLIMRDGAELVFVEVRARTRASHGGAAASVTSGKQARIATAAQFYLQRYDRLPPCRIDVVAIDGETLDWLRGAVSL